MAGLVGTLGMLAEASGTGAELDLGRRARARPAPALADWLTCFPGFGVVAARRAPTAPATARPAGGDGHDVGRAAAGCVAGAGVDARVARRRAHPRASTGPSPDWGRHEPAD